MRRRQFEIKRNVVRLIMDRKLKLLGHICRMDDNRSVKIVVYVMMYGKNKRGRHCREWIDDIKEWCQTDVQSSILSSAWRRIDHKALDTNGREPME